MRLPSFDRLDGRYLPESLDRGCAAYDEYVLRLLAAPGKRGRAVALVGRRDDVGGPVRAPFEPAHRAIEQIPPALKAGQVELGDQVVLVEHEPGAFALEPEREEEEQVRWIAGVHDIYRPDPSREPVRVPERRTVFPEVSHRAADGGRQRVPVNLYAVQLDLGFGVPLGPLRADDVYFPARVPERGALLPHPPVKRHRKIFHEDECFASQFVTYPSFAR